MIKLIASDVDGTLTESGSEILSDEVVGSINSALSRGITFAVVTGRDDLSLKRLFARIRDGVYYISCNGALCVKDGRVLYSRPIAREDVLWALSYAKSSGYGVVFCSDQQVFVYGDDGFYDVISKTYSGGAQRVMCNVGITGNVYKISFYRGALTGTDMGTVPFGLRMSYDRNGWTELVNRFVNKGGAVFDLQSRLGIAAAETVAFGDALSDADMLARAAHRYSTTSALAEAANAIKVEGPKEFFELIREI